MTLEHLEYVLDATIALVIVALCAFVVFELWDTNFMALGIAMDVLRALS